MGSWMLRQSSERHGQSTGAWVVYPWTTASPHLPMALFHAVVPGEAIWPAGYIFMICTKCSWRTQRRAGLGRRIMLLLAHNNMQLSGDWRTRQSYCRSEIGSHKNEDTCKLHISYTHFTAAGMEAPSFRPYDQSFPSVITIKTNLNRC
ncbi:hypothetical protein M441DRAFT_216109 [Trichoderma asperellum CBS 433.97]|uniref:Uncharacterized protein n=1 Tax=Trichoderma asperellum (strain ATCC 204424 / CBS 433.97 / NBRC 101777) TaxID=1042311 RepID=A0A2T3ZNN9_TRIA4|nr:hypothetical protein M441DRAFT_216109 [Trichoderma asperellum CBS 433.97]PTB46433.1 hypothetical protein M441DRAFT_216109 [Trichoderma asperellum CBS 433.97]